VRVEQAQHAPPAHPSPPVRLDLTVPPVLAREFTSGLPQGGLSSPSQDDMVVSFGIFQSLNGVLVSLADWFHAFKQAMRPSDRRGEEGAKMYTRKSAQQKGFGKTRVHASVQPSSASSAAAVASSVDSPLSDAALQVRFLTCLTTLANLGYLKSTHRRVDHMLKLTLHRPY
jgi:hypothetical protein